MVTSKKYAYFFASQQKEFGLEAQLELAKIEEACMVDDKKYEQPTTDDSAAAGHHFVVIFNREGLITNDSQEMLDLFKQGFLIITLLRPIFRQDPGSHDLTKYARNTKTLLRLQR